MAAVVLFLAFGSLAAILLPIATALVGVGTAYAAIGLLGHAMNVAEFAPMLGMLIGLGVGIDYALFIVTRHRQGLQRGLHRRRGGAQRRHHLGPGGGLRRARTVCIALLGMLVLRLSFLNGVAVAASAHGRRSPSPPRSPCCPPCSACIGMRALSRRERRRLAAEGPRTEEAHRLRGPLVRLRRTPPQAARRRSPSASCWSSRCPLLSLRLGTSDQGNNPATSTTRQAYDLLAEGFGPGFNGPLTLIGSIDGAEDRMAFTRLTTTLAPPRVSRRWAPRTSAAGATPA